MLSKHPDLEPVAAKFGIPYHVHPVTPETKAAQQGLMLDRCRDAGVAIVVLARYMQVLGEAFIRAYPRRMINIHHSFLPAFAGARP